MSLFGLFGKKDAGGGSQIVDEHFVPAASESLETALARKDLTSVHHLIRYEWARAVLRTRGRAGRILDLGSGDGYGAAAIAREFTASQVLAVDYDPLAVKGAAAKDAAPNLEYREANSMEWSATIGDEPFDGVVSFDVLEHVPHRELVLEGIARHLADDGVFLFSTPSGAGANLLTPPWTHHKIEYCAASLYDFLGRYFREVVGRDLPGFPCGEVFDVLAERGVEYLSTLNPAVCSKPIRLANPYRR